MSGIKTLVQRVTWRQQTFMCVTILLNSDNRKARKVAMDELLRMADEMDRLTKVAEDAKSE